jgi:EmrB/QacA subfamily drug resistance transporter
MDVAFKSRRGRWILAITVVGSGIAFLEATVVNVALPTIGRDLDASVSQLQWVLNGYLITLAALILLGGALGDRLGRRRIFEIGVVWFTLASAACAFTPSVEFLIFARIFQGIGGALLTPASLAIIEATFKPEDRAPAIGAWSALTGISGAVGPLVGGWLIDAVSWRAIFFINLPLGLFVILASRRHVPESRDMEAGGTLDYLGPGLAVLGLAAATFALIEAPVASSPATVAIAAVVGVIALASFVVVEERRPNPMLPLDIFRSRQFTSANLVTFAVYGALGGVFFLFVAFLQVSLGYSPIAAGAASLPITVLMLALSSRSGALATRIGPRLQLTVGPLLVAVAMLMMSQIGIGDSYVGSVLPAMVVFGLGLACTVAPITATAMAAAPARHSGLASGVNNAVSRTAQLFAVAALPVLAGISGSDYSSAKALESGFQTAMLITAAAAAAGGILAWLTISNDVLAREDHVHAEGGQCTHCAIAGTPLIQESEQGDDRAGRELEPVAVASGAEAD